MERAVDAAAGADVAVVMVGTNDEWETEGFDRTTMDLPGRQDELIRRVVAANPRTAVIVNAGSPVTMDWASGDAPEPALAVLTSFFAGQEQAEALVDVLFGDADPGGRLPLTIPARLDDHPAASTHRPIAGTDELPLQRYAEGMLVGYRSYDQRGLAPRFPFGHGLSYGPAEWGEPTVVATSRVSASPRLEVVVPVTATGARPSTVVVQGYVGRVPNGVDRGDAPKELRTWSKLVVAPGDTVDCTLLFDRDAFTRWDPAGSRWVVEPGEYELVIAASASDERYRSSVVITP
jgi:beta-glucosidase